MSNKIAIRAFQHLSFETLKNGGHIPSISSEVCIGAQNKTILEGSLSLEVALERMIEKRTLAEDAVRDKDREVLLSQIDSILEIVKEKRKKIWENYFNSLKNLEEKKFIKLPNTPKYATNNGHMFYIVCNSYEDRTSIIKHMKSKDIHPVFHYLSLNKSEFYLKNNIRFDIPNSDIFTDCLLRLPLYYQLSKLEQNQIIETIQDYAKN